MSARFKIVSAADFRVKQLKAGEPVIIKDSRQLIIPVADGDGVIISLSSLANLDTSISNMSDQIDNLDTRVKALEGTSE